MRARLLHQRRQHVAEVGLGPPGALHVKDRGLQDAPERQGLDRRPLGPFGQPLHRLVEKGLQLLAELLDVGAGAGQQPLATRVVAHRVEEVLEGQVGVAPGQRFARGQHQDPLEGGAEHGRYSSSRVARSGNPSARASSWTITTLVSATS